MQNSPRPLNIGLIYLSRCCLPRCRWFIQVISVYATHFHHQARVDGVRGGCGRLVFRRIRSRQDWQLNVTQTALQAKLYWGGFDISETPKFDEATCGVDVMVLVLHRSASPWYCIWMITPPSLRMTSHVIFAQIQSQSRENHAFLGIPISHFFQISPPNGQMMNQTAFRANFSNHFIQTWAVHYSLPGNSPQNQKQTYLSKINHLRISKKHPSSPFHLALRRTSPLEPSRSKASGKPRPKSCCTWAAPWSLRVF